MTARTRASRLGVVVAVTTIATLVASCESAQVERVNETRAERLVSGLAVSEPLTIAARAHAASMCSTGIVAGATDPAVAYGPEPAVEVVDVVGAAVLDRSEPDWGRRNGAATSEIWERWEDEPVLLAPAWDVAGVGEHECPDGRLYMTLVLRDDPPVDCTGTGSVAHRDLAYRAVAGVDPDLLSLDLFVPVRPAGCPPAPLVVFVHGGGFRTGDKANRIEDKVDLFTAEGWAFASVNYRLSPDPPNALPGQVRFPVHEQDVAAGIAWLAGHDDTFGIDAGQILLLGHSSGAYLVSLLATDPSFLVAAGVDPEAVRCTASLDTEYDAAAQIAEGGTQEVLFRNALGDDPGTWAAASPVNHVGGPGAEPSFLIVTRGAARRVAQAQAFASALTLAGTDASAMVVDPLSHEQVNSAVGADGDTAVTPPLLSFSRSCLASA